MAHSIFQLPKPKTFLFCVPLKSAVQLILFILLINKISGLYGILALFTGYELNFTQLSNYVYNLATLVLVAWLASSMRKPEAALKTVALAWIYVLDTLINTIYTFFFVASWFSVLAGHLGQEPGLKVPGAGTIEDTAGFTTPEIDASHVEIDVKPSEGVLPGQHATIVASNNSSQPALLESGGLVSLLIIGVFFLIRLYFCLIVLSYARGMLRQYVVMTTSSYETDNVNLAENPFREGREEGRGLRGKLGRALLHLPSKQYWLGMDAETRRQTDVNERKPRSRQSADMGRLARKESQ